MQTDNAPAKRETANSAMSRIGDDWISSEQIFEWREPFRSQVATKVHFADLADLDRALDVAVAARPVVAGLPGHDRARILRRASALLGERTPQIASVMSRETGKAISDANQELSRAVEVLGFCAEEAIRIEGRHIPLDGSALGVGKVAIGLRFPIGIVAGIVPFNAPVNLACHKIGPALAAGNPIVIKAPPQAAYTLQLLVQACVDAGFPTGAIGLLHGDAEVGRALVRDPRVEFISFTGSAGVGAEIKAVAGTRGCILELGGVGPTIVHSDAEIEKAAPICAQAGFRLAGQSCASVQNLFVHEDIADDFTSRILAFTKTLKLGDPADPRTNLGPVIDEHAAARITSWLAEAREGGAKVLCGGRRHGTMVEPTLVTNVSTDMMIVCREVFGPVIVLRRYRELEEVFEWIRGTGLGLNCGLFTAAHAVALRAVRELRCASIIVNGATAFRPDQLPYGGLRGSGYGRESPRDTVRAMTEERLLVFA
ncbi:aldehyde dehydrogenase family protein [Pikeienuella piscinae]|uniref:Aldehyde dehydrogenase family protein n=1 Tax=Pikeienuella piscinae TaxID=2748098 RepID=A0A7L5C0F5_9RHOB|nr:aldehyde dehydrogenase family protein [Pikeienuella piscinae]QIE56006.1 aldehyde dehydrogenase family protein [Pikeienuella piscinae]